MDLIRPFNIIEITLTGTAACFIYKFLGKQIAELWKNTA